MTGTWTTEELTLPLIQPVTGRAERPTSLQRKRATDALEDLIAKYRQRGAVEDVSFRNLVGPLPADDLTHSVHPYPARLLRQIPRFLLHCDQLAQPGQTVLDPFCGSGTVLVEARSAGLHGWGIDCNPFARLLTQVKTTRLEEVDARHAARSVLALAKGYRSAAEPDVVNIHLWFSDPVRRALSRISRGIDEFEGDSALRNFLLVALSLAAERCSLRDPRIPVPVRRRDWNLVAQAQSAADVWIAFADASDEIARRLGSLPHTTLKSVVIGNDALSAGELYEEQVDGIVPRPRLVLTSPPYGAAQKYIRSSSLSIGWAGLAESKELATLERQLIGREHVGQLERENLDCPLPSLRSLVGTVANVDQTRAAIYAEYFRAMEKAIAAMVAVLEPGGVLALIAGSNVVCGQEVETHSYLRDIATSHGLEPLLEVRDQIRGRSLMTKRAGNAGPLQAETLHLLRKESA